MEHDVISLKSCDWLNLMAAISLLIGSSGVATIQQIIERAVRAWQSPTNGLQGDLSPAFDNWLRAGSRGFKQMMLSSFTLSIIQHIKHNQTSCSIIKHCQTSDE